jgi:spore maturation protein CgeB
MRIFYASGETPNGALGRSTIWRRNLYDALVSLGHDVVELRYDLERLIRAADSSQPAHRRTVERERPRADAAILRQIEAAHAEKPIDLFFSYFYSSCASPDTIRTIRQMGITTVNWYCNGSYQLDLVAEIAPAFDYCLVPEEYRLEDYRQLRATPIYCQEAANPDFYNVGRLPYRYDVVFVGACYAERPVLVRRLLDAGVRVTVFGPGWGGGPRPTVARRAIRALRSRGVASAVRPLLSRRQAASAPRALAFPPDVARGILPDDELPSTFASAKIVLGFSTVGATHNGSRRVTQLRLRDFEVPMSGGFYLVENTPELARFFEPEKEVATYGSAGELVEKCIHYLHHDLEREEIRRRGHERALRDHSWQRRLTEAFAEMGLRDSG